VTTVRKLKGRAMSPLNTDGHIAAIRFGSLWPMADMGGKADSAHQPSIALLSD